MNPLVVVLCIILQPAIDVRPPGLDSPDPVEVQRELTRRGIGILQIIDVRTSQTPPLPALRESITLPLPEDSRLFIVDGSHPSFDAMFAVRLQPDGRTQRIDGFAMGRLVVVGVSRRLDTRYKQVLRHELVHAYLNVVAPNRDFPSWFEEGLACYFSASPSHLNDETYRLYERDMRYLFSTYGGRMRHFLVDAITSSDPGAALFVHFRIPSAVHLHLMRLSWENAFWMALILVPILSAVLGRFLSELLYPWYVDWRRAYLSRRYREALETVDKEIDTFGDLRLRDLAEQTRKAVRAAASYSKKTQQAQRCSGQTGASLFSSACKLIQDAAPALRCFGADGGEYAQALDSLRLFSTQVEFLLSTGSPAMQEDAAVKNLLDTVDGSLESLSILARFSFHGPWLDTAQEYLETVARWRRNRGALENTLLDAVRSRSQLESLAGGLARFEFGSASSTHYLPSYCATVREAFAHWIAGRSTLQDLHRALRQAESSLWKALRVRWSDEWFLRALQKGDRLDVFFSAICEPEDSRRSRLRAVARTWGYQDYLPRVRRDGVARWLHPPDSLETTCFCIFFAILLANWGLVRRLCAFMLLGLDRFMGGG